MLVFQKWFGIGTGVLYTMKVQYCDRLQTSKPHKTLPRDVLRDVRAFDSFGINTDEP